MFSISFLVRLLNIAAIGLLQGNVEKTGDQYRLLNFYATEIIIFDPILYAGIKSTKSLLWNCFFFGLRNTYKVNQQLNSGMYIFIICLKVWTVQMAHVGLTQMML